MAKIKTYKNVKSFSDDILGLDSYDRWLISTKNKIIAAIVKTRKKKGISQKELADMLETSQSVISRIEKGTSRSITLDYLMKVVAVLGISPTAVLKKAA